MNFDDTWHQLYAANVDLVFWPSAYGGGMPIRGYAQVSAAAPSLLHCRPTALDQVHEEARRLFVGTAARPNPTRRSTTTTSCPSAGATSPTSPAKSRRACTRSVESSTFGHSAYWWMPRFFFLKVLGDKRRRRPIVTRARAPQVVPKKMFMATLDLDRTYTHDDFVGARVQQLVKDSGGTVEFIAVPEHCAVGGQCRARLHCRFVPPLIHFIPASLT